MNIAIIGAGPAGSMAAVQLARRGASVALFDPSHPREKPCGGGVTGRALALVSDVIDISSLRPVVVTSASVESPGGNDAVDVQLMDRGLTPRSSLVVLSRTAFDSALADAAVAAGARLIPEKVVDVCRKGSKMVVRTGRREYEALQVLGADGANSLVRKRLARSFTRAQLSVAAGFFVRGTSSSAIAIKCIHEQPGYLWSFPRTDHLAVGICARAAQNTTSHALRAQSLAWIERHGLEEGNVLTPYAWPIPSVGFEDSTPMSCSGPGWMLLGDAAGLVDPLTREGIFYALLSGQWAAEVLAGSPARAEASYAERLRDEVQPELARAARLSPLFFNAAFAPLLVAALRESPAIRQIFADLVSGIQPYRGLRRRLLATRQWKLAGKAIRLAVMPSFAGTIKPVVSPHAT